MSFINKIIWSIAIPLMFINSIYFSIKLKFPQLNLKKMKRSIKQKEKSRDISSKDTLLISLASKLGAGSLAGISYAIYYGGIGTIFWIWISTFFTSINCYIENILSIKYKSQDKKSIIGGPSKYIRDGLKNKNLSIVYSLLATILYIVGFTSIQNNTITSLTKEIMKIKPLHISILVSILSILLINKGIKKVSKVCNKIVPIMTFFYLLLGMIVIMLNIKIVPKLFLNIIKGAFNLRSGISSLIYTFTVGVERSIFASEAGVGTSAMASSLTDNTNYLKQGYFGVIETFFINFIITTITSFMLLLTNYNIFNLKNLNGIELTKYAFFYHFGSAGEIFLLIILVLFSFSTIITCYYYGQMNINNLYKKNKISTALLKLIAFISLFLGGIRQSSKIWAFSDTIIGIMAIINIYSMYKLRKVLTASQKAKYMI